MAHLIDIKAMPTNTALTASLRPAYSNANGSISYNVRKAITPPTNPSRPSNISGFKLLGNMYAERNLISH